MTVDRDSATRSAGTPKAAAEPTAAAEPKAAAEPMRAAAQKSAAAQKRGKGRGKRRRTSSSGLPGPLGRLPPLALLIIGIGAVVAAIVAVAFLGTFGSVLVGGLLAGILVAAPVLYLLRREARARRAEAVARTEAEERAEQRHQKTRAAARMAARKAERRIYSQLESLIWLRDTLDLDDPLPSMRGWAASPDLLRLLVGILDERRPGHVVELGSGVSTIVIAARLRAIGAGHLVSIEHGPAYAETTRTELRHRGLSDFATVVDAPLGDVQVGERTLPWYVIPAGALPDRIELLLVDGPPASGGTQARYPALPVLRSRMAPGATIVVDDARREDEQATVKGWQAEVEGLEVERIELDKDCFRLTLPG